MFKMATVLHPVLPTNPTYIKEEEDDVKVTIIEGDNSSDLGHIGEIGIKVDHHADKTQEK